MANIFDVAKYILDQKGDITSWELQKLCYYCKAWSLALDEGPLFAEDFEDWVNGPACRELFDEHRGEFKVSKVDISKGDKDNITPNESDVILAVLDAYQKYDGTTLRQMTHHELPWIEARHGLPNTARDDTKLKNQTMASFYRNNSLFDSIEDTMLTNRISRREKMNKPTYSFADAMSLLSITADDLKDIEDVSIEQSISR